jgi:uncharacterized protein (TIRG00374 family)
MVINATITLTMPHTKKPIRKILEFVGLTLLLYSLYVGRGVLADSLQILKDSDVLLAVLCFAVAWANFLWSGLGYHLLVPKTKLQQVILVHLAASGPGRVVPGGAGHFSFGVLYLRKQKLSLEKALAVATVNNVLGFVVNILLFVPLLIWQKESLPDITINIKLLGLYIAVTMTILTVVYILYKRRLKKGAKKTSKEIKSLLRALQNNHMRTVLLIATMLAQVATHVGALMLASYALGQPLSVAHAFIAMSTGVAIGSLLPTPGGIGGVEAGIIASLIALGVQAEQATAIALLYRTATYLQPLLPGVASYMYLRHKEII